MTPGMGEGCSARHDAAPKTHTNGACDFAPALTTGQADDEQRTPFTSLRDRLALSGYSLHELSCDGYLIARWNLTRHAPDLRAVGAFLRQIGHAA